jgi:hypothetical protein
VALPPGIMKVATIRQPEPPMPYNRQYTRTEVHDILTASERRYRPNVPVAVAHEGHAISQHADGRADIFDRASSVKTDGRFLSRKDLILAVTEALNSAAGQTELARLSSQQSVAINATLVLYQGKLKAEVVHHAVLTVPKSVNTKKWVPAEGPPHLTEKTVLGVTVIVDRLVPVNTDCSIHIQTAYPKT